MLLLYRDTFARSELFFCTRLGSELGLGSGLALNSGLEIRLGTRLGSGSGSMRAK